MKGRPVLAGGKGVSVVLLAENERGYGNLCRLVSLRQLRDEPLDAAEVCEYAAGLVCLIGRVEGESPLLRGDRLGVAIDVLRDAFAGRFYVELAIHTPEDAVEARRRYRVACDAGVPVVATAESRCLRRDQDTTLKALASIGTLTLLDELHPDKPEGLWHFRSPAEMGRLFQRCPEALASTLKIAERCDFRIEFGKNRFPAYESANGESAIERLRELCVAGCRRRYVECVPQRGMGGRRPTLAEAMERLERELAVIGQVHYAEYFLVFHEINEYCRGRGIATLARGSAADSLVCYALGVSHACPFRFDLPFDRFLNPERAKFSKMADIDLDLPWDRREEVMRWVYDRWGHDRVAMIGAPNTYRARAAVAELGKVYGLPPHEAHRFTKRLPFFGRMAEIGGVLKDLPESRDLPVSEEPYRTIMRTAVALDGLPHHWSMHPCGLVVSPEPLTELVPVQRSSRGILTAQYDMDAIEELGFIKIDLLGQAGLSVLRDCVAEVARTDGARIDLETDVDYADDRTWEMIATGGARGVHHIESPAMTSLIRQCNCRDIDALTAIVAIIRPGAANQNKKERFARRLQGFERVTAVHPAIAEVLAPTYGLMIFEEHILQVATAFAGMNIGRADVLRRALNKQNMRMIAEMTAEFCESAWRCGRSEAEIRQVWEMVSAFEGFMFNKAHSAEYAVEAFQGAWLKCRWPAQWLAAVLSNSRGFYAHSPTLPQIMYVLEALRLGIGLRPPCVNRSGERFTVEYERSAGGIRRPVIRVPVTHVQGLSERFRECYLAERNRGVFASLADFVERCGPGTAEAQILLDCGALDGLCASRPAAFWELRRMVGKLKHRCAETPRWEQGDWMNTACSTVAHGVRSGTRDGTLPVDRGDGRSLTLVVPTGDGCAAPPIDLDEPDMWQVARREMELIGFPVSVDPMTLLGRNEQGEELDMSAYIPVGELGRYGGRRVTVCGVMAAERINTATTGEVMKFVTLADRTGVVEAILFPDAYQRFGHLTVSHPILAATGMVEVFENRNGFTLRVESVSPPRRRRAEAAA